MRLEVQSELNRLKEMIKDDQIEVETLHYFLLSDDYEDDYSGNEIWHMQDEFTFYAREYLKDVHGGSFAIVHSINGVIVIARELYDKFEHKEAWSLC